MRAKVWNRVFFPPFIRGAVVAGAEAITQLLQRSALRGSRSTVMTPLGWLILIEFFGLGVSLKYSAPEWVLKWLVGLLMVSAAVYVAGYIYFALTNPDALRSEKFSLSKMAIEKSIKGDSLAGLIDADTDLIEPHSSNPPKLMGGK